MDQAHGTLLDDPRLRGPLDVDAFYRLAREGVIPRDARVELIEGRLHWMSAIGSPHAGTVNALNGLLIRAVGDRAVVAVQNPVLLDRRNQPQPDLAVLAPRADSYRRTHPSAADVLLLIEVADSSLPFDRGRKRKLYARFGVREYWVVDVAGGRVEVCRGPGSGGYAAVDVVAPGADLTVAALPGIVLSVEDVLG